MDVNGRYQRKPKTYTLKFEDYPGLQVVMKGLSIDGFMSMARQASSVSGLDLSAPDGQKISDGLAAVDGLFSRFAASLLSWNLDDEKGEPVPADLDGVTSQDFDFILEVTLAWMDAIAAVDPTSRPAASEPVSSPESGLQLANSSSSLSS